MLNPRKFSQDPVFNNLVARDRLVVLRSPLDELDTAKRNGTASLDTVAAALAGRLPKVSPNHSRSLHKDYRVRTNAERIANGGFGEAFEDMDYLTACIGTVVKIESYHETPTSPEVRNQLLVAVYDPTAPDNHYVYVDGSFRDGDLVPAKFVPIESEEARYGYVRRYAAGITDWALGELTIFAVAGKDYFATAKKAGGPLGQPDVAAETADWKPAAAPVMPTATPGGAQQWVAGPQKEGALVFDDGITYRVRLDIANSQAPPADYLAGFQPIGPAAIPGATRGIVYDEAANSYAFDYQPLVFTPIEKGARVNRTTGAIVRGTANKDYYLFEAFPEPGVIYDLRQGTGDLENAAYFNGTTYLGPLYNLPAGAPQGDYSAAPLVPAGANTNVIRLLASSKSPAEAQYVFATQFYNDAPLAARVKALEQGGGSATLLTATYTASAAGAQTIAKAGATAFFDVGKRATSGQVYALSNGTGYTTQAGQLTILAAAGVQAGEVIEYAYLTGRAPVASGTLPVASATQLGGVMAGGNIHVAADGTMSYVPTKAFLEQLNYQPGVQGGVAQRGYWQYLNFYNVKTNSVSDGLPAIRDTNMGAFIPPLTGRYACTIFLGFGAGQMSNGVDSYNTAFSYPDAGTGGGAFIDGGTQWGVAAPHPELSFYRKLSLQKDRPVNVQILVEGSGQIDLIAVVTYDYVGPL